MVAFNRENLPNQITTIESLAVWAISILRHVHPTESIYEQQGQPPVLAATLVPFDVRNADTEWNYTVEARVIGRVSIGLSADYQTKPIWEAAVELGDGSEVIPSQFLEGA